jgi:hypothetical protein
MDFATVTAQGLMGNLSRVHGARDSGCKMDGIRALERGVRTADFVESLIYPTTTLFV